MLQINNIEVVYSEVILVLRGVSLAVPDKRVVSLLGATLANGQASRRLSRRSPACCARSRAR